MYKYVRVCMLDIHFIRIEWMGKRFERSISKLFIVHAKKKNEKREFAKHTFFYFRDVRALLGGFRVLSFFIWKQRFECRMSKNRNFKSKSFREQRCVRFVYFIHNNYERGEDA